MDQKKFRSLNSKLYLSGMWAALLLLIVVGIVSFAVQYERSKINTIVVINQLMDTVEDTVTVAAYSKNQQIAEEILTGLLKNDVINKVIITSKEGFKVEKTKIDSNAMKMVYRTIYSLFDPNNVIGSIQIQPSDEFSLIEAKNEAMFSVIVSFSLIGLTAIMLFLVMKKYISSPLMLLSYTLNKIRAGEQQKILVLKNNTDDELGLLRTNINSLLSELDEKFNNETELRQNIELMAEQLRHMYNASSAGLFLLDLRGVLLTSNSTLKEILNIPLSDETKYIFSSFIKENDEFNSLMSKSVQSGQLEAQDFLLVGQGGDSVWVHCLLSKIRDSSGKENIEGVLFNVTSRVESEIETQHNASHDPLTGLLRRQALQHYFEILPDEKNGCFLMMDLDGFKEANDTHGHLVGDQVLKIVAERLALSVRSIDFVCRYGGDEFLVFLYDYHHQNLVLEVAERIVLSINKPMNLHENIVINVGISVGVSEFKGNGKDNFESMLKKADDAMYEVKRHGKNGYCIQDEKGDMMPKFINVDF